MGWKTQTLPCLWECLGDKWPVCWACHWVAPCIVNTYFNCSSYTLNLRSRTLHQLFTQRFDVRRTTCCQAVVSCSIAVIIELLTLARRYMENGLHLCRFFLAFTWMHTGWWRRHQQRFVSQYLAEGCFDMETAWDWTTDLLIRAPPLCLLSHSLPATSNQRRIRSASYISKIY